MSTKVVIKPMKGKAGPSKKGAVGPRVKAEGSKNTGPRDIVIPEEIVTEEHFILRMPPGEPAAKLREAVKARDIPENVSFAFADNRKGTFQLGDKTFQTKLVDLPCIIESQKTLDAKQFYKIADISQMLVVEDKPAQPRYPQHQQQEEEFIWPDGLTAPLRNVRKRRFRKRLSKRAIEDVEREVERLLKADAKAIDVTMESKDPEEWEREQDEAAQRYLEEAEARDRADRGENIDIENDADENMDGDYENEDGVQYTEAPEEDEEVDGLVGDIFNPSDEEEEGAGGEGAGTPAGQEQRNEGATPEQEGSDDESEGESEPEETEEQMARREEIERLDEQIVEDTNKTEAKRAEAERHNNPLMKKRTFDEYNRMAGELAKSKKRLADLRAEQEL
ncbi:hypothetical protein HK097_008619 [Rhizophlyctis rosea]|uniref:TAFII55 protein conserved region domain-containing protein n=1 Tax=Rhizophlyctis rosea TaxID=64517 RepID=A0AAD5SCU0_9FUNG|nr:hypothetical protein HK097_008619 [Rhizophlyctis rosea]